MPKAPKTQERNPKTVQDVIEYLCPICEDPIEQPATKARPLVFHKECKPVYQHSPGRRKRICAYKPCHQRFELPFGSNGGTTYHPDCKTKVKQELSQLMAKHKWKCQLCGANIYRAKKRYKQAGVCVDCSVTKAGTELMAGARVT